MKTYTKEELQETLNQHKLWLQNQGGKRADLRSADLRSADLRSVDLRSVDLRSADLYGVDLSGANLYGANLSGVNLYGANLSGVDLSGVNLRSANLRSANLYGADLSHANLSSANLRSANLRYANLRSTVGEMEYIKSLQCEKYYISYTSTILNIGCESHTISEWWNFDDDTISKMDNGALEWWQKWKPILMQIIEISPALESEAKE